MVGNFLKGDSSHFSSFLSLLFLPCEEISSKELEILSLTDLPLFQLSNLEVFPFHELLPILIKKISLSGNLGKSVKS